VIVTDEEVEIRYVVPTSPEEPHQPFCYLRTDYLPLLPLLASGWNLAKAAPSAARAGASPQRKKLSAQRWDSG